MTGKSKVAVAASAVRMLTLRHLPSFWAESDLHDDLSLMGEDIGLDSVEVAELLLDCEEHFGVTLPPEITEGDPLTIRKIVDRIIDLNVETLVRA